MPGAVVLRPLRDRHSLRIQFTPGLRGRVLGGLVLEWECINGQWEDSMHTAGAPSCYCPPTDAQEDGSIDAGVADTPEAPGDSLLDDG